MGFVRARRQGLRAVLGFALSVGLVACGGGGGGDESSEEPMPDLSVLSIVVNYDGGAYAGLQVFQEGPQDPPEVTGLQGHAPHFEVAGGLLPDGLTLDADTGAILGRPTLGQDFSAVIRLTVEGYTGHLDTELHFSVAPFWFSYPMEFIEAQRGLPVSDVVPMKATYDDEVTLSFSTWPEGTELPPGLVLNSTTGEITGSPSEEGSYAITIVAKATYAGQVKEAENRIDLLVSPIADVGFGYETVQWDAGQWLSVEPYVTLQPGDTLTDFKIVAGTGIPGMTVDGATGTVSGNVPASEGTYSMTVEATFKRGSIVEKRQAEYSVLVFVP
jgi:hypothetical protein